MAAGIPTPNPTFAPLLRPFEPADGRAVDDGEDVCAAADATALIVTSVALLVAGDAPLVVGWLPTTLVVMLKN
jgi:hypothetical protein